MSLQFTFSYFPKEFLKVKISKLPNFLHPRIVLLNLQNNKFLGCPDYKVAFLSLLVENIWPWDWCQYTWSFFSWIFPSFFSRQKDLSSIRSPQLLSVFGCMDTLPPKHCHLPPGSLEKLQGVPTHLAKPQSSPPIGQFLMWVLSGLLAHL